MQIPFIGNVKKTPNPWLLGLIAAGTVGLAATIPLAARNSTPQQNVNQLMVPVTAKTVTARIRATGKVEAIRTVNINPKEAGILEELLVEQGQAVKAGQLIARMDTDRLDADLDRVKANLEQAQATLALLRAGTRPEVINQAQAGVGQSQAQVIEAEAGVARADAQLAQSQARLRKAQADLDRYTQLNREGVIATRDLDLAQQDYQVALAQTQADQKAIQQAKASLARTQAGLNNSQQQLKQQENGSRVQEIAQAVAQVKAAEANLKAIQTQMAEKYVRAPFDGVITQAGAKVGAFVSPTSFASQSGSATSIATLANGLEITAKVPEIDISQIRLGQAVEIKADAYPDKIFQGVVQLISPEAREDANQKGVVAFEVKVKIVTGKEVLRSGMTTDLAFMGTRINNALMVPSVAIVTNKGQTGVLVPGEKNKPEFKPVTIGSTIGNETQILSGLQSGDQVFKELPEGTKLDSIIKGMEKN